jgi:two-component system, OmpR family, sensor kinase
MTRRTVTGIVAACAPVLIAAIVAAVLFALGERRQLVVATAIPALVLLVGAVVSAVVAIGVGAASARRRSAARHQAAYAQGVAEGRAQEQAARRRFLARLDHELKNPITAIRATLAGAADPGAPLDGPLQVVDGQARRLATLVADLRKLSEIETRPLETEPVVLEELVREAVTAVEQQRPEMRGRVAVTVSRVPWPIPVLAADPDLLSLALDNVLGNAAKFAQAGPIEVRLREDAGWAVVEVADTGRGVPLDAQPQVFDELARASNARDVAGSGIGLALVRTILQRHGGDAELRSREGAGTVVALRLPIPR